MTIGESQSADMNVSEIPAIDVHAHYGRYDREGGGLANDFRTGFTDVVLDRAKKARIRLSIVSPLAAFFPRGQSDSVSANEDSETVVAATDGLLRWVVVDPTRPRTFDQAVRMLRTPKCAGIKIHPETHAYPIREHGRQIFEFAARHRAVVSTHSGEQNSLPEDFVVFADDFPEVTLILAHLGCGHDGDLSHQVRAVQASRHGNVFIDTSSASSINSNLVEWAVRQVGAEKILFGTDSPLYFAPMQRARIDFADISDAEKELILCRNAAELFHIHP
jgi:uncharacterized protein